MFEEQVYVKNVVLHTINIRVFLLVAEIVGNLRKIVSREFEPRLFFYNVLCFL